MTEKQKTIFVGAFSKTAKDGTIGGQGTACRSLVESPISEKVNWIFVNSAQRSQPPPNLLIRLYDALLRLWSVVWHSLRSNTDSILIFTGFNTSSFLEKGLMAIIAKLCRKHVVISIRSELKKSSSDTYLLWFRKWTVRCCDAIICQSDHAASMLTGYLDCPEDKIFVIPNWIDSRTIVPRKKDNGNKATFVFMGWIEKFKGVQHLVDAADQLKQQGYDFTVNICGGGSDLETLKSRSQELQLEDMVKFHGWVAGEKKMSVLSSSSIAVLPSYSEGMPNSLLEAMTAGLAVIATPVGGIPSLIQSENQGILVDVGDTLALADAMKHLLENEALVEKMSETNRQFVMDRHEISAVWPRVANALNVCQTERVLVNES